MKKSSMILFMMFIGIMSASAQKPAVVVGAVGKDPKPGLSKALEIQIKAAFVKDGRFTAVTREEAVLAAVDKEQAHQRTGAVDDAQVKALGKQIGARYVCVVEVAPLMNSYQLNAQFVDIVSTNIVSVVSVTSTLRNTTEFHKASEELVRKLLGYQTLPTSDATNKIPIKHVAVIETQINKESDEAKDIRRGDLGEITSALRREAVKNLPRNRFNVMTSETVQSMGAATAKDCEGENCIITLGSKIGADYIVRGTLSKNRGRFSLTVEMFETEYGNLVAVTPSPIRTADLDELLDKSEAGCAAMYKSFAGETQSRPQDNLPSTTQRISTDGNSFTDPRDGKIYRTVVMPDGKTWMAENLNYVNPAWMHNNVSKKVRDGDNGSWCYGNREINCKSYGRLYTWSAAMEACPTGWHLPSDAEWTVLINAVGGFSNAGTKLKSPTNWKSKRRIPTGTNDFVFSALPGGNRLDGMFNYIDINGYWWTATRRGANNAHYLAMGYSLESVDSDRVEMRAGLSVRCVKNNE